MQTNGTDCGVHVLHNMSIVTETDEVRIAVWTYKQVYS